MRDHELRRHNYYQDFVACKSVDSMNDQAAATMALCGLLDELNTLFHLAFYPQIRRNCELHEATQKERHEGRDTAVQGDPSGTRN